MIFFMVPILFLVIPTTVPKLPCLISISAVCSILLLKDNTFLRSRFYDLKPIHAFFKTILLRSLVIGLSLAGILLIMKPEAFFHFPKTNTTLWMLIVVLYPILSAYPQELIYRGYFFHRYKGIFRNRTSMIWASTFAFAFMHIIFENPVAPFLTLPGGYLFAKTYERTQSLAVVGIEHAIYGDLIFTMGLGMYFYKGF
ncbi:CAAX amino terminal protease family protein [delta proteobacterium NaphS2]|nr:CAAX amino terminal protease family protein [delta proteobacterium NaphS2]